jgi:hypothetical protein
MVAIALSGILVMRTSDAGTGVATQPPGWHHGSNTGGLLGPGVYLVPLDVQYNPGTGEVTWNYLNRADYDLNGEVNQADITQISRFYNQASAGDPQRSWVDGDGNGEVTLGDLQRIGANFGSKIIAYSVLWTDAYDFTDSEKGFREVAHLTMADRAPGYPPRFVVKLPSPVKTYVKVEALPLPDWVDAQREKTICTDPSLLDPDELVFRDYVGPDGETYRIVDGVVIVGFKVPLSDPRVQAFIDAEQLKLMNVWDFWPEVAAIEVYLPAGQTVEDAVLNWPQDYPAIIDAVEPDYGGITPA